MFKIIKIHLKRTLSPFLDFFLELQILFLKTQALIAVTRKAVQTRTREMMERARF